MNYLQDLQHLRNTYYVLRHGRSVANDQELIVSHPEDGVSQYGLTEEGRGQVARAVEAAMQDNVLDATTVIFSSDFARARESAEIARALLNTPDLTTTPMLRERFFGTWDKQHNRNYEHVWADDILDGAHKHHDVESTQEVVRRTTAVVRDLERGYSDRNILLVSHGDALQILQTAFERVDSSQHRLLPHLETGHIRKLELKQLESVRRKNPEQ